MVTVSYYYTCHEQRNRAWLRSEALLFFMPSKRNKAAWRSLSALSTAQVEDFYNAIVLIYDFKYDESVQEVHNDTFGDFRFMGSVIYNYSSKLLIKHLALKFGELPWEYEKQLFRLRKHQIVKIYCNFPNIICLKDIEAFL